MKTKKPQAPIYMHGRRCVLLEATINELRQHCPTPMPVVIAIKYLDRHTLGNCARQKKRFVIALNALMKEDQAIDVVLHEWAHAMAWNLTLDKLAKSAACGKEEFEYAAHDEAWGCAYARVYRLHVTKILPAIEKAEQELKAQLNLPAIEKAEQELKAQLKAQKEETPPLEKMLS